MGSLTASLKSLLLQVSYVPHFLLPLMNPCSPDLIGEPWRKRVVVNSSPIPRGLERAPFHPDPQNRTGSW